MPLLEPVWLQNTPYAAQKDRQAIYVIGTEGVAGNDDLNVRQRGAGADMSVDVDPGIAFITGSDTLQQGRYLCESTEIENVQITTAPGSGNSRIDLVYAYVEDSAIPTGTDQWVIDSLDGTPSTTPSAPSLPESAIPLAHVFVGPSVSQITDADITDLRPRSKPYLLKDGVRMDTGPITMDGQNIVLTNGARATDPANPTSNDHLSRKAYVDNQRDSRVAKSGDTMSGILNMGGNRIQNVGAPTADDHAATRGFARNASNLSAGTVPNERISGNYHNINDLRVSGYIRTTDQRIVTTPIGVVTNFDRNSSSAQGAILAQDHIQVARTNGTVIHANRMIADGTLISCRFRGNQVGSISVGSSTTSFNTSSDYRLKTNERKLETPIERTMKLKPYTFNFKDDLDNDVDGFFAHEVQEVVPNAVEGQKDAVDENGEMVVQQVDHSKLVPLLVATVQEQQKTIEALMERVTELEQKTR